MQLGKDYIYGKHPVFEALTSKPDIIEGLWLQSDLADEKIIALAKKADVKVSRFRVDELPSGFDRKAVHQGMIALVSTGSLTMTYKEFVRELQVTPETSLVLLDEIEDPQNVGAIIRSATAFGLSGVLIPDQRQAQITGAVIKVSAGMALKIPLISIKNVNATLRDLKERGFWIYGLTGKEGGVLSKEKFDAPTVFVVGAENTGIREKTLELCDIKLKIPIDKRCESLNAGTAAAVTFYEWSQR